MQQADPIEFENADLMRAFRAEFYDQAVHKVHQDTKLTLMCATGSACDGVCTDLMADVYAVSYGSCCCTGRAGGSAARASTPTTRR